MHHCYKMYCYFNLDFYDCFIRIYIVSQIQMTRFFCQAPYIMIQLYKLQATTKY